MILSINSSKPYDVEISTSFDGLKSFATGLKAAKILLVTDENVSKIDAFNDVNTLLKNTGKQVYTYVLPSGEHTKSEKCFFDLHRCLLNHNFSRKDLIIAFGGGVVGDLTGFVASTYMRGIRLIQIPTTLLSMVDSSVGGKTAINLDDTKNIIGTFYSAIRVFINVKALKTLPQREINSGMGEVIKYAFLSNTIDDEYLNFDNVKNDDEKLMILIKKCLEIKKNIVENDEFEGGARALLNLGHTLGHAVEALSDYSISHGESVLKGLNLIIDMSKKYYALDDETYNAMKAIIKHSGIDFSSPYSGDELLKKVTHDKKSDSNGTTFVLLKQKGMPELVKLKNDEIRDLL